MRARAAGQRDQDFEAPAAMGYREPFDEQHCETERPGEDTEPRSSRCGGSGERERDRQREQPATAVQQRLQQRRRRHGTDEIRRPGAAQQAVLERVPGQDQEPDPGHREPSTERPHAAPRQRLIRRTVTSAAP